MTTDLDQTGGIAVTGLLGARQIAARSEANDHAEKLAQ